MILSKFPNREIAKAVPCSERAIRRIRSRLSRFGTTTAPANRGGPDSKITTAMRDVLCEQLTQKPDMIRREMVAFVEALPKIPFATFLNGYDNFGLVGLVVRSG
jgi:transposase